MVKIGLEQLLTKPPAWLHSAKLALLSNQASTASDLRHGRWHLEQHFPGQLACLFSPQHGFFAEKQDNMIESPHQRDPHSGLPVFSLYGESRRPDAEMFALFDVLLIDLIDVGTRVYTFMYTMAYCLEMAAETGKKVVILDRPNPIGGLTIEGNILEQECSSFVGLYPLPMRHGLTIGELARYINREFRIDADLEVVPMEGWKRHLTFRETRFPWVFPSPNMPTPETAAVYPGQVIWEGTNLSEGRGTTMPFELVGAPFIDTAAIEEQLRNTDLPGCYLRPVVFEPTSGKFWGEPCNGFQIHVTDSSLYKPYRTSLALLQAVMILHPEEFEYKTPPYEYEYERLPMDLILGSTAIRQKLERGIPVEEIEMTWMPELNTYNTTRGNYYIYPE